MTATCGCGQPITDAHLCTRCTNRLRRDLHTVPDLVAELDTVLARDTAYAEHHGGASADKPLPIDTRASEASWVLRNTLTTWARILHDERAVPLPTPRHERHSAAIPAQAEGEWTTPDSPEAQEPVQRCDQTDLPTTSCHHCRSTP